MSPRRRLSEVRRYQILEAAVAVIGERGICDTRISDVAQRAGTSSALILYYFDSKDRLLADALSFADDRFYAQLAEGLAQLASARDQLVLAIESSCPPSEPSPGEPVDEWLLWLDLWARAARDPGIARDREQLDRRFRETIAGVVRAGQRAGEFTSVDANDFALRLCAMIDGLAVQVVLGDPYVSADRMRSVCLRMAARELGFSPRRRSRSPRGRIQRAATA